MSRPFLRHVLGLAAIAVLTINAAGCEKRSDGPLRVVVIGSAPKLRDPAAGPLSISDAVLLQSVARGLVSFDSAGNIVGGLAERWNVSDDGLSYIFRLASDEWADGQKITAQQVTRQLKRQLARSSKNPLSDALGAVEDIVPMTDRVIEIRLRAPRPNLLALLAQPEMAVVRNGHGTGPFAIEPERGPDGALRMTRALPSDDGEVSRRESLLLSGGTPDAAVRAFAAGEASLVLGGTFADLSYVRRVKLPRASLRFDPASGLFGLVPLRKTGPFATPEARRLLSQAIDRDAIVAAFAVPNLAPRATLLEPGLDGIPPPAAPAWTATPLAERLPGLQAQAESLLGTKDPTVVRVALPTGPGADLLLRLLQRDWGRLGLTVERAERASSADFQLLDLVAPSPSPAWFLRRFRCDSAAVCDPAVDELTDAARDTQSPPQRYGFLAQAAALLDEQQLFIPVTAPIRWSLVSPRVRGFAGNRYARHTLTDLQQGSTTGG